MIKRILQIMKSNFSPSIKITSLKRPEFIDLHNDSKNSVLIDVRTSNEVAEGKIIGAVNIDFLSKGFLSEIAKLDKDKTYFVYCRSGQRSVKACKEMQRIGIVDTINLEGGFLSFQELNTIS